MQATNWSKELCPAADKKSLNLVSADVKLTWNETLPQLITKEGLLPAHLTEICKKFKKYGAEKRLNEWTS